MRGGGKGRTSGREKIANLWTLTHERKAYMDVFTIYNLYPQQDVVMFFEKGTPPHEIRPSKKKVLYWVEETGEEIFTKHVHVQGMKATRMVERTEKILDSKIAFWITKTLQMVDKEIR